MSSIQNQYTIEFFGSTSRRVVTAAHWWDALAAQSAPCFTVISNSNGSYSAVCLKNDVFPIPGEHVACDRTVAASEIINHYHAVRGAVHL